MAKKYVVDLNEGEKADLVALIQKVRSGARKSNRRCPFDRVEIVILAHVLVLTSDV